MRSGPNQNALLSRALRAPLKFLPLSSGDIGQFAPSFVNAFRVRVVGLFAYVEAWVRCNEPQRRG